MLLNKHGSFYIRNGWPTKIVDAVLLDDKIFSPNNELDAVDTIGVGRVMIKAMRYWSTVLGITEETKTQSGVSNKLTSLGKIIHKYDPYFNDLGSLWLLHRNLAINIDNATAWAWAFNIYEATSFSKEDFSNALYSYIQYKGSEYNRKAVEKEFDCFKNTYVSDKNFDISKIIEEDTVPFLAPLKLIKYNGSGIFEKRKTSVNEVPIEILFYCIVADNSKHLTLNNQIDIEYLLNGEMQVGKYMNLSYTVLLELLQKLESKKYITVVNNFGNKYIQLERKDSDEVLQKYFQNILR